MALLDIDTWLTEFNACERLSQDIQSQIVVRNRQPRLSPEYSKISNGVRFNLKQFASNLEQLSKTLTQSATLGSITVQEAERRQRQIESLQSQYVHLESQFKGVSGENTQRHELLSNGRPSYWQNDDDDDDDDEPLADFGKANRPPQTVDELRRQQNRILADQDEGLDNLSKVISRQKHLALRIGDEVDDQNVIIDNLATTMESTDTRIGAETRNVGYAIQNESTKCYWLIIILLFVLNIIVALL